MSSCRRSPDIDAGRRGDFAFERINGLIRRDRVKPRPYGATRFELMKLGVKLQERILEYVFRQVAIAHIGRR